MWSGLHALRPEASADYSSKSIRRNNDGTSASFAKFFAVFVKLFDVFGPVRTCFYAFRYIRIHSDALGKKKNIKKKVEKN